jgi:hypothetical protein
MDCRFFKYLLLLFTAIAVKSKGESKNSQQSVIYQRIFGPSSYSEHENSRCPNLYYLGSYGSNQIYRSQSQRTVNFLKSPFAYVNKFKAYCLSLNYTFRHTSVGHVRSSKLILFPFHVFW